MTFLDYLFHRAPTPDVLVQDTPAPLLPVPLCWDTTEGTLNGIPLGAPVTELEAMGPCPHFSRIAPGSVYYEYPHLGVLLEITNDRLEFINFAISEDDCHPLGEKIAFAAPLIQPKGVKLTPDLDADTLTKLFGPFELMDMDDDEIVGNFRTGSLCYEATFAAGPRLTSLVVYRDE